MAGVRRRPARPERAMAALTALQRSAGDGVELLCAPGSMGADLLAATTLPTV